MYISRGEYLTVYSNKGAPVYYSVDSMSGIPAGESRNFTIPKNIGKRNDETKRYEQITYDSVEVYIMNVSSVSE